jgi:hypothetical protein
VARGPLCRGLVAPRRCLWVLGRYVRFIPEVLEEWWTARLQGPVHCPYPERTPNNNVGRRCANTPTRGAQEK